MLRLAYGLGKAVAQKTTKPALYLSLLASVAWLVIDLADGAGDRFHLRYEQAKDTVIQPAGTVAEKVNFHASKLWQSIEDNPGPSILAIALFAMTVGYHKWKGRSTVAALKAGLLKEAPIDPKPEENPLIAKMHRQAIENQMLETYDKLEARQKVLPDEIKNADEALKQATRARQKAEEAASRAVTEHLKAQAYRDRLQKEFDEGLTTLVELERELDKA